MANDSLFRERAPLIMRRLIAEFALDAVSAAAIVGNLGHESGGFKSLQEKKPLVPGSKGGYGYAQWTGPRRTAYINWCGEQHLDPASHEANVGFLVWELRNTEKQAIPAVKRAEGLRNKVVAFELAFERAAPQYKAYDSRERWATLALTVYTPGPAEAVPGAPVPVTPIALPAPPAAKAPPVQQGKHDGWFAGIVAALGAALAGAWTFLQEWLPEILLGLVLLVVFALVVFRLTKGRWPWTGHQLPTSLLHSLPSSGLPLEQLSGLLAQLSGASSAPASPPPSASPPLPLRSAARSRATRKRASGSRRSIRKRSSSKRKSRSKR